VTVPDARELLLKLATDLKLGGVLPFTAMEQVGEEIEQIVLRGMHRRRGVNRTAPKSRTITPALSAQMRAIKAANPDLSEQEIGNMVRVNNGRVSEAFIGKRR
jgi:hypothetical protein